MRPDKKLPKPVAPGKAQPAERPLALAHIRHALGQSDSPAMARAVVRWLERRAELGSPVTVSSELAVWVAAHLRRLVGLEDAA
jgi:hypothetical protein